MSDFRRSPQSSSSYSRFMGTDYYILLENENDMYYWRKIITDMFEDKEFTFDSIASSPYFNKKDRGKDALKVFLKDFESNSDTNLKNKKVAIIWDADYDIFDRVNHEIVIDTYGYTIENTLLCPNKLTQIILDDVPINNTKYLEIHNEINIWYSEMVEKLRELMILNIAVYLSKKERMDEEIPTVMGRASDTFMNNNKSVLDNQKIESKIREISIEEKFKNDAIGLINASGFEERFIISGHFWETLVQRKVENIVKKQRKIFKEAKNDDKISEKYTIQVSTLLKRVNEKCLQNCQNRINCKDYTYITNKIRNIIK